MVNFYSLDGITTTPAKEIRYLGTYITATLNRNNTVHARCKQALKNAKILKKLIEESRMEWQTRRLLYKMVIEPTMIYGLKCAAITKANRAKLRRYERIILRDLLNNTGPHHTKIHEILNGKTVTKRIKCLRMCYYGHILRRPTPHLLNAAYQYQAIKLKVGRPIFTWIDSLTQDMKYYNKNPTEWADIAINKTEFIKAAQEIYELAETDSEPEEEL
ncbi:uncharacterized protein LOC132902671 [Amyelois transitella]|uniref:uncharacterized protein LOC132902671 n=1 Tax=Amyelois transitella TaxID=680683 RepID=UPI00298FB7CF|nr:uncharacterized protein LOC132902671 [Amyelois transitella]